MNMTLDPLQNPDPIVEQAVEYFNQGYSCSQSILLAFAPLLQLSQQTALLIAAPFGGGIAQTGNNCGAVSGALMVIGMRKGHTSPQDKATKEALYVTARDLMHQFEQEHGNLTCQSLLGFRLDVPEEAQKAREAGLFKERCPLFVRTAARLARICIG